MSGKKPEQNLQDTGRGRGRAPPRQENLLPGQQPETPTKGRSGPSSSFGQQQSPEGRGDGSSPPGYQQSPEGRPARSSAARISKTNMSSSISSSQPLTSKLFRFLKLLHSSKFIPITPMILAMPNDSSYDQ